MDTIVGVYKALSKHDKRFEFVAGTSIGAINAAIITSSIADDDPSKKLEKIWMTLAKSIGSPIAFSLSDENRAILSTTFSATWGNLNVCCWIPGSYCYRIKSVMANRCNCHTGDLQV